MKRIYYIIIPVLFFSCITISPTPRKTSGHTPTASKPPVLDSAARNTARINDSIRTAIRLSDVKPYPLVIGKSYKTQQGLFNVHTFKDTVYFEIPDSLLKRDIMVINRIKKAPGGLGIYAGEELDEKTILIEKGANNTLLIRYDLVINEADSTDAIYKSVVTSSLNPLIVTLPIKAYGKDSSCVVDITKFLKDNNSFVHSIDQSGLKRYVDAKTMKDINIESIHAYPINVEVSLSKTGIARSTLENMPPTPFSLESNTSFILLPRVPMQRRYFDRRVGYFADYYFPYSDDQQKTEVRQFIVHWRLEPRAQDREKWKKGQLVEPEKPIVFYIDPGTPKQWRKYLIMGINDWQAAFEQAGFKNAIIGKEWPENDATMHMDDARYSILHYFPSNIRNAYGPQVHDPRSGEIIQSRIGWYHNVMQLLHDWYQVQAGANDPRARAAKFDPELMGQLIRFVSSHEVGHTLGLRHNFGSSSRTPVDSLRSKSWLQKHGHTASIMDYARFNYVAQPEDHLTPEELFPRIGEYDRWAIQWGYGYSGAATAEADRDIVAKWIRDSLAANPRLWFGDGELRKTDPRCQTEDLGDNPMKANAYGIKNLQRILPHLPEWSREPGGTYLALNDSYKAVKGQFYRYMNHACKYIGGVYYTVQNEDQPGDVFTAAPKQMQKEALDFINTQLFNTPYWLLDKKITSKASEPESPDFVEDLQVRMINTLLDVKQISSLSTVTLRFGTDKALGVDEYFSILHKNVWSELLQGKVIMDSYRRNLQKSYLGSLQSMIISSPPDQTETDAFSVARADVMRLQLEITRAIPKAGDNLTRYHLEDMASRIKKLFSEKPTP